MATYKEIQERVRATHGYVPKSCWIADVKDKHGLTSRQAPNRKSLERKYPCPANKRVSVEAALRHFGMIK